VMFDSEDKMYGLTEDGWVMQIDDDGSVLKYAYVGGRPLGGAFDAQDNLFVADAQKGLLMIERESKKVIYVYICYC